MTNFRYRAREASGVNSYPRIVDWLTNDIGDIGDLRALAQTKKFVQEIKASLATNPTLAEPEYLQDLENAIKRIEDLPEATAQLSLLNETLRSLFVNVTITSEAYGAHADSLRSGEELTLRRRSRTPLPTMDAFLLLKTDPRSPSACERAALVVMAALKIHASNSGEEVPILGTTLVPGMECDGAVHAEQDLRFLLLCSGVPYIVNLEKTRGFESQDLRCLFDAVQKDALAYAAVPGAWTGEVPALITAVSRTRCFRIRESLGTDPQNALNLTAIDTCLFAVCLDPEPSSATDNIETVSRGLFGNYCNRWYGMTSFVFDGSGQAGIILSYTRGIEAIPALAFADAVYQDSLALPLPVTTRGPLSIDRERLEFHRTAIEGLSSEADAELETIFHSEQAFFDLPVGSEFFRTVGASANSGLQYLIMLACHEVVSGASLPAISHAVSTADGSGFKGGMDWIVVSTVGVRDLLEAAKEPGDSARFHELFCQAANRHTFQVNSSRHGYSPSSFIRKPESVSDRRLYEFFAQLGLNHETGYRSYLFRATRWPSTMDILTSTLRLPDSIPFCGRPGSTCEVAELFGLHIVMKAEKTHLFFIPNPRTKLLMRQFHQAIERWIQRLRIASEQAGKSVHACA